MIAKLSKKINDDSSFPITGRGGPNIPFRVAEGTKRGGGGGGGDGLARNAKRFDLQFAREKASKKGGSNAPERWAIALMFRATTTKMTEKYVAHGMADGGPTLLGSMYVQKKNKTDLLEPPGKEKNNFKKYTYVGHEAARPRVMCAS